MIFKIADYEKIANELGRSEYAILIRVIDKILFKKYNDNVNLKDLSLNYNIPSNFLKERFNENNINTDMMGKKWNEKDDEYLKKSIEEGISYIEIAKNLKRKTNGVIRRVVDKHIYKKFKDGEYILTLKEKYNIPYSVEFMTKIFNKLDNENNTDMINGMRRMMNILKILKRYYIEIAKNLKEDKWVR